MSIITLFSAPKPFTDPHIATIQRNAIKSWTLLPDVDVILMGNDEGIAETAQELDVKHIPNVVCNDSGTPLISSMFELTREISLSELLCIINTDMILMSDFVEAAKQAMTLKEQFVLISQRWDLDVNNPLFFWDGWTDRLGEDIFRHLDECKSFRVILGDVLPEEGPALEDQGFQDFRQGRHFMHTGGEAQCQLQQFTVIAILQFMQFLPFEVLYQHLKILQFIGIDRALLEKYGIRRQIAQNIDGLPAQRHT